MKNKPPKESISVSPCPDWLTGAAAEVWNRTSEDLSKHGLYDPAYDDLLANFCIGQGAVIDGAKKGEPPQAALLAQIRQLSIALYIDPESRRKKLWYIENRSAF